MKRSRIGARIATLSSSLVVWLCTLGLTSASLLQGQDSESPNTVFSTEDIEFFETSVRPLLVEHCWDCHSGEEQEGGLRLDYRDGILKGGDSGPAITLEDHDASLLLDVVGYEGDYQMPPDSKLPPEKIAILTDWVKRNAPWPRESIPDGVAEEGFDLKSRREAHWCWNPPRLVTIPETQNQDWAADPIDRFLLKGLETAGLKPAGDADKATWLRRLAFDLTGLPPTVAEVQAFVDDTSPEAYSRAIDGYLASERFGEHWARRWMDLTRYAETYGHEFDYPIEHAFRYRDYLIRAFNEDVPYNQFVQEHVAGDLLTSPRRHPTKAFNESILGTGFWFLGEGTHGPVDVKGDEAGRIDNQIDVMTKSFLGLTVSCARCHDHKFDAISTDDYYAISGFLQSSRRQVAYLDPDLKIENALQAIREQRQTIDTQFRSWREGLLVNEAELIAGYLECATRLRLAFTERQLNIEGESLELPTVPSGQIEVQTIEARDDFRWAGNQQLWWRDGKPQDELLLKIDVPQAGDYELLVNLTKAPDYGIVSIWLDDHQDQAKTIDAYAPQLAVSQEISLGQFALTAGQHLLHIKIEGTHKQSIARHMFGLDYLVLKSGQTDADRANYQQQSKDFCREFGLDAAELERWVIALRDEAMLADSHPLSAFQQLANAPQDSDLVTTLQAKATKASEEAPENTGDNSVVFCDFSPESLQGWGATGWAFEPEISATGRLSHDGQLQPSGVLTSSHWGTGVAGSFRSPTFELTHDMIHYRLRGENVQIRLVIDGFMLDNFNALLFNNMTVTIPASRDYQWFKQQGDIKNYRGHQAYIEINDLGNGWIELDEIRFANSTTPNPPLHPLNSHVVMDLKSGELSAVAERTAVGLVEELEREIEHSDATETPLLNWILKHDLTQGCLQDSSQTGRKMEERGAGVHASATVSTLQLLKDRLAEVEQKSREIPSPQLAIAMTDGTPENEHVFIRGNHKTLGPVVPRRSLTTLIENDPERYSNLEGSGRREFANELVDPENPLTSRVMVNRLWHHMFGRGIVASTDNFGVLGEAPTHPELLDYLAIEFVADDWSIKRMLKRLALTRAYRLSSLADPRAKEIDPDNLLMHSHRVRRLSGEEIRDAILKTSGSLDDTMYGPSVPVHLTPFMQGRGRPGRSGPLDGNGRRSVYLEIRRNFLNPMMLAFDTPIPFNAQGRRNQSNVPAQALILMNDPFVIEQAQKWAMGILAAEGDRQSRIEAMLLRAFGRPGTAEEIAGCLGFLETQAVEAGVSADEIDNNLELWADLCHVIFNLKAFSFVY